MASSASKCSFANSWTGSSRHSIAGSNLSAAVPALPSFDLFSASGSWPCPFWLCCFGTGCRPVSFCDLLLVAFAFVAIVISGCLEICQCIGLERHCCPSFCSRKILRVVFDCPLPTDWKSSAPAAETFCRRCSAHDYFLPLPWSSPLAFQWSCLAASSWESFWPSGCREFGSRASCRLVASDECRDRSSSPPNCLHYSVLADPKPAAKSIVTYSDDSFGYFHPVSITTQLHYDDPVHPHSLRAMVMGLASGSYSAPCQASTWFLKHRLCMSRSQRTGTRRWVSQLYPMESAFHLAGGLVANWFAKSALPFPAGPGGVGCPRSRRMTGTEAMSMQRGRLRAWSLYLLILPSPSIRWRERARPSSRDLAFWRRVRGCRRRPRSRRGLDEADPPLAPLSWSQISPRLLQGPWCFHSGGCDAISRIRAMRAVKAKSIQKRCLPLSMWDVLHGWNT